MSDTPVFQHDGRTKQGKAEREAWRRAMEPETMSEDQTEAAPVVAAAPKPRVMRDCKVRMKQPVPVLWDGKWRRRGDVFSAKRGEILVLRGQADEVDADTPERRAPTQMESLEGEGVL